MLNEDKNLLISLYSEDFLFILTGFQWDFAFWFLSDNNLLIDIKNDLNLNNEDSFSIINFIRLINLLPSINNLMYQINLLFMEQIKTYKRSRYNKFVATWNKPNTPIGRRLLIFENVPSMPNVFPLFLFSFSKLKDTHPIISSKKKYGQKVHAGTKYF